MRRHKTLHFFIFLGILLFPVLLSAEPMSLEQIFKRSKIRLETALKSPGNSTLSGKISTVKFTNPWLLVFVDYAPSLKAGKTLWLEDITLEVQVFIPLNQKKKNQNYLVLSGNTAFRFVMIDGRLRTAVMAVPPQILDRYLPVGKKISTGTIRAKAFFRSGKNTSRAMYYSSGINEENLKNELADILKKPTTIQITDGVLPRENTPWQFMNFDQSDLVWNIQKK